MTRTAARSTTRLFARFTAIAAFGALFALTGASSAARAQTLHEPATQGAGVLTLENAAHADGPVVTDSIWFVTNRSFENTRWRQNAGPLLFGMRAFDVTLANPDRPSSDANLRATFIRETQLDESAQLAAIAHHANTHPAWRGSVLVYVHGYATSLKEATRQAAQMRRRAGFSGPVVVFAWPSKPSGVTWPAFGRVFSNAYWQDSVSAATSAPGLAHVLTSLTETLGANRVVLAAHSMGNQLVAAALGDSALRSVLSNAPLRAVAFVSPDLDAQYFREHVVPTAQSLARRTVLYAARDDHMLALSSLIHHRQPRAGRIGADTAWPDGLDVVDMTEGRVADNGWPSLFNTNHAFPRERTALLDFFDVVVRGAPSVCRFAHGVLELTPQGIWRATDAPIPGSVSGQVTSNDRSQYTSCTTVNEADLARVSGRM